MPTNKPDTRLTVRYAQNEYALLKTKAGDRPLSTFVRELTLNEASKRKALPKKAPIKDHVVIAQILAKLGKSKIFSCLNGLDEAARLGVVDLDEESQTAVRQACADIAALKNLLMKALGVQEK